MLPNKTYLLRIDEGEEIVSSIINFCKEKQIGSAKISGIGAVKESQILFYDSSNNKYGQINSKEQKEIVNLQGNISQYQNDVTAHIHISLSDRMGKVSGGHLQEAIINPTAEIFIEELFPVERKLDSKTNLKLLEKKYYEYI